VAGVAAVGLGVLAEREQHRVNSELVHREEDLGSLVLGGSISR
jgi:hypothetical protein